jgi:hypothetical protein
MGTSIWHHVEYLHKKKNVYCHYNGLSDFDLVNLDRHNAMFCVMGGARRIDGYGILFPPRGLPQDVTHETWYEYHEGECDFHHESWLDTDEFQSCIDYVRVKLTNEDPNDIESIDASLRPYQKVCDIMRECDQNGEPARLVFWFDN